MTIKRNSPCSHVFLATLLVFSALLGTLGVAGCGDDKDSGGGQDGLPQSALLTRIADSVDAAGMQETVDYLASSELRGRPAGSPQNEEVTSFLEDEFRDLGLEPFTALGLTGLRQEFIVPSTRLFLENPPATEEAVSISNVIGVIPGTDNPDFYVVIAANFDGLGVDTETGEYYPGADYNASGAAAVLELARVMASLDEKPPVSLVFAEFNAEESGYFGSKAMAEEIEKLGLQGDVLIIDLEGLASGEGEYMDVWDQNFKKNRPTVEALDEASAFLDVVLEINGSGTGSSSDLFFLYHIPSVTCDWSWYERSEHPEFHTTADTASAINLDGLYQSARVAGVAAWLLAVNSTD